jgi:peptidoglycan/LPS O-acetylase OafA/YrhL
MERSRPAARRLAGLDGVRGVAVLLVVLSHAHVPFFGPGGIEGVTTFFTLSGFLITGLLLKEHQVTGRIDLLAFWGRRALRLLPALVMFVAVTSTVFWVVGWGTRAAILTWTKPVLLYYSNLQQLRHQPLGPFPHTWSLAVEEQFYLVWPLLLVPLLFLLRGRRGARVWLFAGMVVLTALSVGWRLLVGLSGPHGGWVVTAPQTTIFSMTAGACLAVIYEHGWRPGRWAVPVVLAVLSAYFWLPLLVPAYAGWVWGPVLYTMLSLVLIAWSTGERPTPVAWRPLRFLGTVSYGWYLWHFPVTYVLVTGLFKVRHLTAGLWLGIAASLLVAAMSWHYVERPLQRRFRRRLERVQLSTASGPAGTPVAGQGTPDGKATDGGIPDRHLDQRAAADQRDHVGERGQIIDLTALGPHPPR